VIKAAKTLRQVQQRPLTNTGKDVPVADEAARELAGGILRRRRSGIYLILVTAFT